MPKNLISLTLLPAQVKQLDRAMDTLETELRELIALEPKDRVRLTKMGDKSEAFCRKTLDVIEQNPQIANASLDLPGAKADLEALDILRPRRQRLERLLERMKDTETLLGTDVMAAALEAYGLLKVSGKSQGLDSLRTSLGARFKGQGRRGPAQDDNGGGGNTKAG